MKTDPFADLRKLWEQQREQILRGPYEHIDYRRIVSPPPPELHTLAIKDDHWFRHAVLIAQTGGGKTNVLRWRIEQLLPQLAQGNASLILMEPKGDLTREVLGVVHEQGLDDRLIFLDPGDPAISVNLFETTDQSAQGVNETIHRLQRIFSTITMGLTAFQMNTLTFAIRAMLTLPPPRSLDTFFDIIRNGIAHLPVQPTKAVRNFFEQDFKDSKPRANEVIGRLNALLADPVFEALFSTEQTTFDIFDAMQAGRVIIINAGAANPLYGRFWIEEVARTIRSRIALPQNERTPTTFIIDEASTWISEDLHFAHILDVAREARLGMFIALQHMSQIKDSHVRNSLYTNTALKFVAKTSADIHDLCRSLGNAEPRLLTTLNDYEFAHFGPNMQEAEVVKFPLVQFPKGERPRTFPPAAAHVAPLPEPKAMPEQSEPAQKSAPKRRPPTGDPYAC